MVYDVIIIGAGPAGLSAGLYAGRSNLKTLIFEKETPGGQIVITAEVENYPGAIEGESGPSLIGRMVEQAKSFGAEIKMERVTNVELSGDIKKVTTNVGTYESKTVILANGGTPRKLGVPGEAELTAKGVSYCATCDANFFEDMQVFVIGGGDTAVEEAMYLAGFAKQVTVVHRRDELRAAESIIDRANRTENLDFRWNSVVKEIKGDGIVESIVFEDTKTGELEEYHADEEFGTFGVFVFVGFLPVNELYEGIFELDESGYIKADDTTHTSIPGVYVAGDLRTTPLRQVVTAAADGAVAAMEAEKYIAEQK